MKSKAFAFTSVIFDLDGTLINTAPDVRLALNHMLSVYGQPEIAPDDIYPLIGGGARNLIQKAFENNQIELPEAKINQALACYLNFYKAHPVVETTIYPGVVEVLQELKNAGMKLGICTNKPGVMTGIVLEKLNLKQFFAAVVAGDEVAQSKPHELHIQEVLKLLQVSPLLSVMVGDSEIDKMSARNAGIPFVGVSYGYDAHAFSGDNIIHTFSELPFALQQIKTGNA